METTTPELLRFQAEVLDDLEGLRIANENRFRQLMRPVDELDADGHGRGLGLTHEDPSVAALSALLDRIKELEHTAVLELQRAVRRHPLHPWIKEQRGIGEKQCARLLAAIGDPYWNDLHDRPRTVSELWAYCGYHTLPTSGHGGTEDHAAGAGGGGYNVAAKRAKGQRANWSATAKMRAYLIAESVVKSGGPWREVYDKRKAATADNVHMVPCIRCGPSGNPALPGSDWSAGHRHADALRITAKEILKGLWIASRDLH